MTHPVRVYALIAAGLEAQHAIDEDDASSAQSTQPPVRAPTASSEPSSTTLVDRLNRLLAPEYVLESQLDDGGEAMVFEARDVMLERRVAIKLIRPENAGADTVDRFLREARILAHLHHPNIVPVYRAGRAGEVPYCVMELIEGESLADRMRRGRLPIADAVAHARSLLDALATAHAAGIIHRQIAPERILLAGDRLILAGFHAGPVDARDATSRTGPALSERRAIEQRTGQLVTERTDVYAAATIIYEALTGNRWIADADPATASWVGVPRRFVRPLRRALEPVPQRRWSDAARFRRALFRRWRPRVRPIHALAAFAALAGAVPVGVLLFLNRSDRGPALADLAILPFDVRFAADSSYARAVTHLIADYLRDIPELVLVPSASRADGVVGAWLHPAKAAEPDSAHISAAATSALPRRRLSLRIPSPPFPGPPIVHCAPTTIRLRSKG